MNAPPVIPRVRRIGRRLRQARMLTRALKFPDRPIDAHLVAVRRWHLSCAYCSEYDEMTPQLPASVQLLKWMFVTGSGSRFFRNAAVRLTAPGNRASAAPTRPAPAGSHPVSSVLRHTDC